MFKLVQVLGRYQLARSAVAGPKPTRLASSGAATATATTTKSPSYMPPKHHGIEETDEEFDNRYYQYLSRPDIDSWELRKALNDLTAADLIPEPKIIEAAFRAARRLNDHSVCVRFLEVLEWKARYHDKDIYPWLLQELGPVLSELGISTPEELGYDKPELALKCMFT